MDHSQLESLAERLGIALRESNLRLVVAESCTGGWVAKAITDVPGSSRWFDRGFVTYSNEAKQEMLGVKAATLDADGAVSETTVAEMAQGALRHSHASVAVAVSGVAGPEGGGGDKPVGMVCFAWQRNHQAATTATEFFQGNREEIRMQAVAHGLRGVLHVLGAP